MEQKDVYQCLKKIKGQYRGSIPPILSSGNALTVHSRAMKVIISSEELEDLEQKGFVELLNFKNYKKVKISDRGYSLLKGEI